MKTKKQIKERLTTLKKWLMDDLKELDYQSVSFRDLEISMLEWVLED